MESILLVIHIILVVSLVLVILLQRTGQDGLSGLSGGGAAGANSLFSARGSANFLTRATALLATVFICTSLALAYLASHRGASASIADSIAAETKSVGTKAAAPVAPAVPAKPTGPSVPLAK